MSKKLIYNSLSGTLLYLINVAVVFVMSPILIRALGNRDYGLWEIVMSVVGYMGLLDLGIGGALVRFVSVDAAKDDRDNLQQTISTAFVIFVFLGFIAVILFFLFSLRPTLIGGSEINEISSLRSVFFLLAIDAAILFPLQVFIATLMGIQRHYLINNVRIIICIIRAFLVVFLLNVYPGNGLIVLAFMEPLFNIIQLYIFYISLKNNNSIPNIKFSSVNFNKIKELSVFSVKNATMLVASRVLNQSIPIIIGHFIGLSQVIYFTIPDRLVSYAKNLSLAIGFPLAPYFGDLVGREDAEQLEASWFNTSLCLQAIAFPLSIYVFLVGESFITLWIGGEYSDAGRNILKILTVGLIVDSFSSNAFRILTARAIHGKCALVWLVSSIVSIPSGIISSIYYGLDGVALSITLITSFSNIVTLIMACSSFNINIFDYIKSTVLKILLPLILLLSTLLVLIHINIVNSYMSLIENIFISLVVYLVSLWGLSLTKENKIFIIQLIKNKI